MEHRVSIVIGLKANKSFAHKTSAVREVVHFCRLGRFQFLPLFGEPRALCKCSTTFAGSRQHMRPACVAALWWVRTCFAALCGLIALRCAVLAVLQYSRCSPFACLRWRSLIGTCMLYGFVRADCAVLCCACGMCCNAVDAICLLACVVPF